MNMNTSKIFGIGLSKTGTTSLANALELLGYRTKDYIGVTKYVQGDVGSIDLDTIDKHDALTDTPIPSFYRELDVRYPGSKFILTVRERASWARSCKKQFTQRLAEVQNDAHKRLFIDLYGTDVFDETQFERGYEFFVKGVLEYFANRPNDLLVIDVTGGEGWEKLCRFLGKPTPDVPFPKANVTQVRWINIDDVVAIARQAGQEILDVYGRERMPQELIGSRTTGNPAGTTLAKASSHRLRRLFYAMRGGSTGALGAAEDIAHRLIAKRLKTLTPQIPVLSRVGSEVTYSERAKWNHLWLVDPLNIPAEPDNTLSGLTVSIALVEDRSPIYGVVFAPASGTMYYAKGGDGSFKLEPGGEPLRLGDRKMAGTDQFTERARSKPDPSDSHGELGEAKHPLPRSHALAICLVAEGSTGTYRSDRPAMEWEIAAAHAIATCAGKDVRDDNSHEALKYNKMDLKTGCFTVD